ncbi:hypothetical protein CFC21_066560 [Triticum aestivum]|uniref:F-box domain-containing protein n=2 Tax=Triticum aestivum TaxID=4565 RepID=A0A9R1KMQ3_WHEAT|nr:hypothetical protein CFC21_066560 [Triticum aestivum]
MAPPRVREPGEMYELVEEVLIRIPPDDPAGLIRASLVCKAWCGLVSGHAFRSHYRVFHKTPPILGFLQSWEEEGQRFVPTTRFRPRNCKPLDSSVLGCRHGRVLLMCYYDGYADADENEEEDYYEEYEAMVVWDPLSGRRTKLHNPDIFNPLINGTNYSATVLCAADGCNHDACNLAPFLVAFVVLDYKVTERRPCGRLYTHQRPRSGPHRPLFTSALLEHLEPVWPGVLVGQALHFLIDRYEGDGCIIKCDLGSHRLSLCVCLCETLSSFCQKTVG